MPARTRETSAPATAKTDPAMEIGVSEFKTRCLEIMDTLSRGGPDVIVTRRGRPIARVVPIRRERRPLRNSLSGLVEIRGDIVSCDWTADWEAAR